MSGSEEQPGKELVDAFEEDLARSSYLERFQTMLLSTGILAFGVALGVRWAAVDTINHLGVRHSEAYELGMIYNHHMRAALAVAGIGLVVGIFLAQRGTDETESEP